MRQVFTTDLLTFKYKLLFMIQSQFVHLANIPLSSEIV